MAVALDGSTPVPVYDDASAATSLVTATFTPPAGSIVVALVMSGDGGQQHSAVTAPGLTFTSRVNLGTAGSSARVSLWTATGTGAATAVTATFVNVTPRSLIVSVFSGAQLAVTPATAGVEAPSGAPSLSLTSVGTGSMIVWGADDYVPVDGTLRMYRSSATERAYHYASGLHTNYAAYQQAASPGSQTVGLTMPTGGKMTVAAVELQASSGAATTAQVRAVRRLQAVARASSY